MKTPPHFQADAKAEEQAAEAVERGTTLIRSHLSNHIADNPDSSFVTWIATLHPENADVTIDQRFLIPGNPWWTVYEEAKQDIPTAIPVPAVDDETAAATTMTNNSSSSPSAMQPHFCIRCSPIDMIVGFSLTLAAFLAVAIMEFLATMLYMLSAVFFHMGTALAPPNLFTGIFYSLCMLLYFIFAIVDSILLITSVFVTEVLAVTAFMLSILFGGVMMAFSWHQYIRRTCHLARWAFRSPFTSPARQLFCSSNTDSNNDPDDDQDQPMIVTAVLSQIQPSPNIVVVDGKDAVVSGSSRAPSDSSAKSLI